MLGWGRRRAYATAGRLAAPVLGDYPQVHYHPLVATGRIQRDARGL